MVTTEEKITTYETWLPLSHASYTLNRYGQAIEYQHDSLVHNNKK